jgi:DNA-binding XRE family transcriptional regulator
MPLNAIENYRVKKKLSYVDMAKLVGVNVPTLWRHATGKRGVSFAMAQKYMKKLGIPMNKIPVLPMKE